MHYIFVALPRVLIMQVSECPDLFDIVILNNHLLDNHL